MIINCIAYQHGKKLADITMKDINAYLAKPDCFVWVALKDPSQNELEEMGSAFNLHHLAVEDASHGHQRPKLEEYGDSLFAVVHLIEPEGADLHVGEVDIFVGANYVLSVRSRSQQTFLGVRDRCEREPRLLKRGPGFVLYALIDAVVDRYFPIVDALESELEDIEDKIFAKGSARMNIQSLYALKQKVLIVKHAVAPLIEAVGKLHGARVPAVCSNTHEYFRDVSDHLHRLNGSVDTIRDTIAVAMQVNLAMATIEENEVIKRIASWAAIFAVPAALASIWGMNFADMPELEWEWGYPVALWLIAAACVVLYWRFKRSGWL